MPSLTLEPGPFWIKSKVILKTVVSRPNLMIHRYVFIKLNEEFSTDEGRQSVADQTKSALLDLPGVVGLIVGQAADEKALASWDISILLQFSRLDDVEPYLVHPDHRSYVDDYLKPKMAAIKAWNFSINK